MSTLRFGQRAKPSNPKASRTTLSGGAGTSTAASREEISRLQTEVSRLQAGRTASPAELTELQHGASITTDFGNLGKGSGAKAHADGLATELRNTKAAAEQLKEQTADLRLQL